MQDPWMYGLSLTVVGMGGTLATLWLLAVVMTLLKRLFPYREEPDKKEGR